MNLAIPRVLRQNRPLQALCKLLFSAQSYPSQLVVLARTNIMQLRSGRVYAPWQPAPKPAVPPQSRKPRTSPGKKPQSGSRKRGSSSGRSSKRSQQSSSKSGSSKSKKGSVTRGSSDSSQKSLESKSSESQDRVSGSRISKQWKDGIRYSRPCGFHNTGGATCYRNSMMQSLLHVPVFCNYLAQAHRPELHDVKKCVACAFQLLSYTYWCDRTGGQDFPYTWINGMYKGIARAVKRRKNHFFKESASVNVQGDPLEFFAVIQEELSAAENDGDVSLAELHRISWRVNLKCRHCGHEDRRLIETHSIEIPITTDDGSFNGQTLIEDLEDYQKDVNQVRCECVDQAEQLGADLGDQLRDEFSTIESSSEILIVQLKRFSFDQKTGESAKVAGKVDFDEQLDLTKLTENGTELKYQIHSVILHRGASVAEGHYIAAVRCQDGEDFYLVDDTVVTGPRSLARILAQQARRKFEPYVLLYQKIG